LKAMLRTFIHNCEDLLDELYRDISMKQIAHRIDEDPTGLSPTPWNRKRVWMTSNDSIEVTLALVVENCEAFVFGLAHVPKPPRHRHGVAVVTTARSSRAACDWVPSRICPFNSAHLTPPQSIVKT